MPHTDNLTDEQRDVVLRFLLHRMTMETRLELMRTLPVHYATLHPGTEAAVLAKVADKLAVAKEKAAAEELVRQYTKSTRTCDRGC